jgi:dTDP-4-amino-4,6-dideoxygalactose transaminase
MEKTLRFDWEYDVTGSWDECSMTDMMAAIRLKQFDRITENLARRRRIVSRYDNFCDKMGFAHPAHFTDKMSSAAVFYLTKVTDMTVEKRNSIVNALEARGVIADIHYKPLPMMSRLKTMGWDVQNCPNAYLYYHNAISLPVHAAMSDEDVEYVIENFCGAIEDVIARRYYLGVDVDKYKEQVFGRGRYSN